MKLPRIIQGYKLEIHRHPRYEGSKEVSRHYSVGYWFNGCLLHFHGGVLLFKADKLKDARDDMFNYLKKVGIIKNN